MKTRSIVITAVFAAVLVTIIVFVVLMTRRNETYSFMDYYDPIDYGEATVTVSENDPIDLVVTWVCPDPVNDALRNYYTGNPNASVGSRTESREELLCLLRSVDMFAPWINHVYIVSSTGYPEWLNINNPRVTVVPHTEIFTDHSALPTFNSHAIESQLHHIPGLSEKYLYANDDMFFGAPVEPSDFFDEHGRAKAFLWKKVPRRNKNIKNTMGNAYRMSWRNLSILMDERDGIQVKRFLHHQALPMLKSTTELSEKRYSDVYEIQSRERLRTDPVKYSMTGLPTYYGLAIGTFVLGDIDSIILNWASVSYNKKLLAKIKKTRPKLFCINNLDDNGNEYWQEFWREYFPCKSSFEK